MDVFQAPFFLHRSASAKPLITNLTTFTYASRLSTQYPRENKPNFVVGAVVGIAYPGPRFRGAAQSPLGAGRVSVVDLDDVGRARKLGLRRRSRGGATRGFAGNSEVVQNPAYRFWLRHRGQDLHAPLALRACGSVMSTRLGRTAQSSRLTLGINTCTDILTDHPSAHRWPMTAASASCRCPSCAPAHTPADSGSIPLGAPPVPRAIM
jgi:hypothetical protein